MWPFGPPNVEKAQLRGDVEELLHAAEYKRDPEVRSAGREALEGIMDDLLHHLGDRNMRRVVLSREALKAIGEPSVPRLVDIFEKGDVGRRQDVAYALGTVGLPSCVPCLRNALKDSDVQVRVLAARALAEIPTPEAERALRGALKDNDDAVRHHAGKSLAKVHKKVARS